MRVGICKRFASILALVAILAAAIGPVAVARAADATVPCALMMMNPSSMDGGQSPEGTLAPCDSDLRCVIVAALPEPFVPASTDLVWTPVYYSTNTGILAGLSVPPDISPPISRA